MRGLDGRSARRSLAALAVVPALVFSAGWAQAAGLDEATQQRVRNGTFEVVQLKPPEGAIQYERALPLDLIPYQQRVDKYRSIGTAFAIGPNRYVTAAHVLLAGMASQFGPPAIRDAAGMVHPIDQVLKFADRRDFAVFSLQSEPRGVEPLQAGGVPMINDPVDAVGNALGEGIVIRDGVYTSATPEELNGEWQWLRFSAAASPGNSGGPLIDRQGKVIGVVLRKTAAENLNYALPIQQVTAAPEGEGRMENRSAVRLVIKDTAGTMQIHEQFKLPLSLPQFYQTVLSAVEQEVDRGRGQLITQSAQQLFPAGTGSDQLLHQVFFSPYPRLIHQSQDGIWTEKTAQPQVFQLDQNGFLRIRNGLIRLRAPDDVPLAQLYTDSKLLMDLVLKGYVVQRQVGSESVRVTSLGAGQEQGTYTDHYGRIWQIRSWTVPFEDRVLSALCLPTPEGYAMLLVPVPTADVSIVLKQQEFLADYLYVSLSGTLGRWQEYLAQKSLQPQLFQTLQLDIDPGQRLHYRSKRFDLTVTPAMVKLSKDTLLNLLTSFYVDGGKVVWDVGGLAVQESATKPDFMDVTRVGAPDDSLPQGFQSAWARMGAHEYPFNAMVFMNNGSTRIRTVADVNASASAKVHYVLTVVGEGTQTQKAMSKALGLLQRSFKLLEH